MFWLTKTDRTENRYNKDFLGSIRIVLCDYGNTALWIGSLATSLSGIHFGLNLILLPTYININNT